VSWQPLVLVVCLLLCVVARGHAAEEAAVAPDRPSVTNSAQTVPPGAIQIETGVEYARTSQAGAAAERRLTWQGTLRLGLTERLEARLEGEPVVRVRGSEDETGAGDLVLGLKYRFQDQAEGSRWPSLGLEPFVKVPTAPRPIGSGRTDFGIVGLASWDLPWNLNLDVNAGLAAVGQSQPNGYLIQGLASASLGLQITGRLSGYVEVFFASRGERDGRHNLGFDTGLSFLLTRLVALDAAVETSLTGRGPDYAVRAGVSVRFSR
jgi:outer membrane putative beta-barrel porin/alpha-amylase